MADLVLAGVMSGCIAGALFILWYIGAEIWKEWKR